MSAGFNKAPSTRVTLPTVGGNIQAGTTVRHTETAYARFGGNGAGAGHKSAGAGGVGWAAAVILFIVLVILIYFILYAVRPEFCCQKDGHGNHTDNFSCGKILFWAVIIALIITIIIGAAFCFCGGQGYF